MSGKTRLPKGAPLLRLDEEWEVAPDGTRVITHGKHDAEPWGDDEVACLASTVDCDLDFKRATLLAAAPDLYRLALKLAAKDGIDGSLLSVVNDARQALKKIHKKRECK